MHRHDDKEAVEAGTTRIPQHRPEHEAPEAVQRSLEAGVLAPGDMMHLQRMAGNQAVSGAVDSPVLDVVGSGSGQPLEDGVRADMESRFGQDFGDVRVHTGGQAQESAASVDAHAYTVGSEIVFGDGAFDTSSAAGLNTLAHELTHVVQQRSGPVDGTPAEGGIAVSDPADRFEQEAEATAQQVMSD